MYISGKKLVEMIKAERENGLTDNEIYAKLSVDYPNKKQLARTIGSIARKKEIEEIKTKNKILIVLLIIFCCLSAAGFVYGIVLKLSFVITLPPLIIGLLLFAIAFWNSSFNKESYSGIILFGLIDIISTIKNLTNHLPTDYLLYLIFYMVITAVICIMAFSIMDILYPNRGIDPDIDGKCDFKE